LLPIAANPGPGFQIVTGTFQHEAAQTLDISVEDELKPIGTTPNHPIWSVDREAFVRADSLSVGERLQTLNGIVRITSITARGPPEPVYNLEVQVKHTYFVADSGVLVHNGKNCEVLERFGNADEATQAANTNKLHLRPGHPNQPKRIASVGEISPKSLGKSKYYTHKLTIKAKAGATDWLRENNLTDAIIGHDSRRTFAIPPELLKYFNDNFIISITKSAR
tara:strand:+ start:446 stop:1111 length:666 start_codon:yes stop_codon:yes gene_type:complete